MTDLTPILYAYYDEELRYLREQGAEFKAAFPKAARRLMLEEDQCRDPHVERLLEGFAFLAARVRLKLDAAFPRFTQHLYEVVYPHYLAPTPSVGIAEFRPDYTQGTLANGFPIPRGARLLSGQEGGATTPCEYRTAMEVMLWPIELTAAEYLPAAELLSSLEEPGLAKKARAAIRFSFRTWDKVRFADLPYDRGAGSQDRPIFDSLVLFIPPAGAISTQLYERLMNRAVAVLAQPSEAETPWHQILDRSSVRPRGFEDHEALLAADSRVFSGQRLLREYFALPERFMFLELAGVGAAARRCAEGGLNISVLLDRHDPGMERAVSRSNFALFCSPVVNLFPRTADRITLEKRSEHQVVVDRTRPMDYEVYAVSNVIGYGPKMLQHRFSPLYSAFSDHGVDGRGAHYTVRRQQRLRSARRHPRHAHHPVQNESRYLGDEVFVSLVDPQEAPYSGDVRELEVEVLCTNRDLPLQLIERGDTTLRTVMGEPVELVRFVAGPAEPRRIATEGERVWRLISQLSTNHLALEDLDEREGAAALRELLSLYGDTTDEHVKRQIDGIRYVRTESATEPMPGAFTTTFVRGLQVILTFDEAVFAGSSAYVLGSVLSRYVARYASVNTFTKMRMKPQGVGEDYQWPARIGTRQRL